MQSTTYGASTSQVVDGGPAPTMTVSEIRAALGVPALPPFVAGAQPAPAADELDPADAE